MIRDWALGFALADAIAAAGLAMALYWIGRRYRHPVSLGTAVGLWALLTTPMALIYALIYLAGW